MYRWYITAAAMRDFLAILEFEDDDGGRVWAAAEQALDGICRSARFVGPAGRSGAQLWRASASLRGRRERIELTVSTAKRPEGDLPQLLRVRLKSRGGRGRRRD